MTPLTSPQNPTLQKVRRGVEAGRALDDGTLAAEGPHLLAEALKSPWRVEHIFCSAEGLETHRILLAEAGRKHVAWTEVAARAFKTVSDTEQTQGILALVRPPVFSWAEVCQLPGPVVVLDGIQDPGNAGTIIRSAEAFGAAGVVFSDGCVRVANGKLLRATAGSIFRMPYLEGAARGEIARQLRLAGRTIYVMEARGQHSISSVSLASGTALVVGSEGGGASHDLRIAAETLSVPTRAVESLNAAVACAVTLYEAARQRGLT